MGAKTGMRRLSQKRRALLVLLFAAGLAAPGARAADGSPWRALADRLFRPVAHNADLPNAIIPAAITQDAAGFIWLGGDGGLLRWDGYQFQEKLAEPALPNGLHAPDVWTMYRDGKDRLWIGTNAGGLARYVSAEDRVICLPVVGDRCSSQRINAIADDGAGGEWVAANSGLYRIGADGQPVGSVVHPSGRTNGIQDDAVFAVLRDHTGAVWVGTSRGLARSADGKAGFAPVYLGGDQLRLVSCLMEDASGQIWVGTRQQGAVVISPDRSQARVVQATAAAGPGDVAAEVTAALEIAPGRVWLDTYGRGIVEVDTVTFHTQRIVHDPLVPDGLDYDSVRSLYRDRSGLIWVGTEAGLSQYNPGAGGVMTFFGNAGRKEGLGGASVAAVYAAPDGSLWAGLQGEGVEVLDSAGHRTTGLQGHRVFGLAPAPFGGVLVGTEAGLFLADSSATHFERLSIPGLSPTADILVVRTVKGQVWIGRRDGGLWELNITPDRKITVVRQVPGARLTNPVLETVAPGPDGRIAIGTDEGFNLLDLSTGAIEQVLPDASSPGGLNAGLVAGFATDRSGRLWVATSTGLDILEGRDSKGRPRFRRLGVNDGLPNAAVDGLLVDGSGRVWASTDMGLAVIDPDTLKVRALQRADGLAITNYWTDSVATMSTGELVFGGIGGLTMIDPRAVTTWDYRPPVVVTAVRIGGKPVELNTLGQRQLVVPADENSLAVEFAALDYSSPTRNRYRYRLVGFDSEWVDTDAEHRVAAYTNLPPGNFTFQLLGSNRNGVFTEPSTTLKIQVLPAWYQTVWFRLAAGLAALMLVAALMRFSTGILRRRQRELERVVRERTAELSVSQLQLRQANAGLERRVADRTQALAERTLALAERTQALESSEARFRAWFNNAEDGVFVVRVERDGRFVFEAVNPAIERIFGIAADAYPGREPAEVMPASEAAGVAERYAEAAKGEPVQFESRMILRGAERLLDTRIVPVRNPVTGRVERLVGATRDMTERRALEGRLAQAQKLQALGGLAGGIAHDFNNILQAVAGAALLIEQSPDDYEKTQRLARSTIAAAERGTSITKRLLAFARSDELRVEAMATTDVLEGLREVLSYTLGSGITVRTGFAPGLPPLLADRGQLETALVNLGTNARDAMPAGGILTLSAAPVWVRDGETHPADLAPGAYVRIDVTDTGTGMDSVTLSRAMEPFFTTKPQGQGTGLGLALVKGFTEQSGGGMTIESTLGAGTKVSLWLRQAAANAVQPQKKPSPVRQPGAATAHIMVVDDDELVRETVAALLEGQGFIVEAAASGAEGVALVEAGSTPDALVCDLSMPGMNGIDTINRVREMLPGLPCFLLTGYAGERAALGTGDTFTLLRKPISASALVAQIEAGLAAVVR